MNRGIQWLGLGLLGMAVAACTSTPGAPTTEEPGPAATPPPLPDLGPAPELTNQVWFNTEAPLRLADLRGQVVLLDFWTFG